LKENWEGILAEYQWGFRPQRKTMDQIFIIRQILYTFYAHDIDLHRLFVDFKKSFDSTNKKKVSGIVS